MKALAAVSIRQYERAVESLADYNRTVEMGFQILLRERETSFLRNGEQRNASAQLFLDQTLGCAVSSTNRLQPMPSKK
jgi:hypothetical protein